MAISDQSWLMVSNSSIIRTVRYGHLGYEKYRGIVHIKFGSKNTFQSLEILQVTAKG